jgi:hypothetical protein
MTVTEIFNSCVRSASDLAGVFEYDGDTGYFYLYDTTGSPNQKVIDSIHILSGPPDFSDAEVTVRWDCEEEKVGLFIRGVLWAVFDSSNGAKYGGKYKPGSSLPPPLPLEAKAGFSPPC